MLDPNVIIAAILSPRGSPGRVFRLWFDGGYELVASPMLLDELDRAVSYAKLRDRVSADERRELLEALTRGGTIVQDPDPVPEVRSPDPDDDYFIALASSSRSVLVSGDSDLLGLSAILICLGCQVRSQCGPLPTSSP